MLTNLFEWLDGHAWSYWAVAAPVTVLLFAWVWRAACRDADDAVQPRASWRDALVLLAFLVAWRWPFLLGAGEYSPDESQLIAGALTLTHDPVFWRSVDGTTSGPLNFYALLPFHWLGLPLDYFTARLAGLLWIWGSLLACHRALARLFGRVAGWLAVLPVAGFFATVTTTEYLHYSSEHLSLLLVALPAALLATGAPGDRRRRWVAGFIAGAAPWAKLQVAPVSVVLIGWGAWQAWHDPSGPRTARWRRTVSALAAAAAPSLLAAILIGAAGETQSALRRYVLANVSYVGLEDSLGKALRGFAELAVADGRLPLLLMTALAVLSVGGVLAVVRRVRPSGLVLAGTLLVAAAVVAVLVPRRGALHYTLLLPVPLTILLGAAIGQGWQEMSTRRARRVFAVILLAGAGLPPVLTRVRQPLPETFGHFTEDWNHPRSSGAMLAQAVAQGQGSLAVWGWASGYYVETGLPQATREAHSFWSILPGPGQAYHRADYVADFRRNRPVVFVDAVGPGAFGYEHRSLQSFETFPELAEEVHRGYALVGDVGDARIYARKDLPALRTLSPSRTAELLAQGRLKSGVAGIVPTDRSGELARWFVGGRFVTMLEPPAWVEWALPGDVREVSFLFGFDPGAYERGRTNGAGLSLELVRQGRARTIWRRELDPSQRPADRGLLSATVALPPFQPGTRLVLRSDAGPYGNAAWDWVYLAHMGFKRRLALLPSQLPGFGLRPDAVDAEDATPGRADGRDVLLVHRYAGFAIHLKGGEQSLRIGYGYGDGTTGKLAPGRATFRVELHGPDQPKILFERTLVPSEQANDRRLQTTELALPTVRASERLFLVIMAEPGGASRDGRIFL